MKKLITVILLYAAYALFAVMLPKMVGDGGQETTKYDRQR
jgi:hypothetical protein